jgi:TolA-binding protein
MIRLFVMAILLLTLLHATLAGAAKEITIDFDTGKTTEKVQAPPVEEKSAPSLPDRQATSEVARLEKIIRRQQQLLVHQQAIIERQRQEIRHQQDINRGLELLCRPCRKPFPHPSP